MKSLVLMAVLKSALAGCGLFVVLAVFFYLGFMTRWTFVPRTNSAISVDVVMVYMPYILGLSAIGAITGALIVYRFWGFSR